MGFVDTDLNPVEEQWLIQMMAIPRQDGSLFYPETIKAGRFSPLGKTFDIDCINSVLDVYFINDSFSDPFLWASEKVALAFGLFESQLWFFVVFLLKNAKKLAVNRLLVAWALILVLKFSDENFKQHRLEELVNSLLEFDEYPDFSVSQIASRILFIKAFPVSIKKDLENLVIINDEWPLFWGDSISRTHPMLWGNGLEFTKIETEGNFETSSFISFWLARYHQNNFWWHRGVFDKKHLQISPSVIKCLERGCHFISSSLHVQLQNQTD